MKPKYRRLGVVLLSLALLSLGIGGMLYALRDNLIFFYTPTQLAEKKQRSDFDPARALRVGGIVKQGSVRTPKDGGIAFIITDLTQDMPVTYRGFVPSLFREGQGVVAQGTLDASGTRLIAATILAKHDEKYMPREVMEALKASGRWREDGGYRKDTTP